MWGFFFSSSLNYKYIDSLLQKLLFSHLRFMNFFLGGLIALGRKKKTVWMGRDANFAARLRPSRAVFGVNWEFSKKSGRNLIAKSEDPVREPEIWIPIEAFSLLRRVHFTGFFVAHSLNATFSYKNWFLSTFMSDLNEFLFKATTAAPVFWRGRPSEMFFRSVFDCLEDSL